MLMIEVPKVVKSIGTAVCNGQYKTQLLN